MNAKYIFLTFIAAFLITASGFSQPGMKIKIYIENNTHEDYNVNGYIKDGTNQHWYSFSAPSGTTTIYSQGFITTGWYRDNLRITHSSGTPPIADYVGNATGPYNLWPWSGPGWVRTQLDNIVYNSPDIYYYYSIYYQ